MKYSDSFTRDFNWYLSMRHKFNFDGCDIYFTQKDNKWQPSGFNLIWDYKKLSQDNILSFKSVNRFRPYTGKGAFYEFDSNGKVVPTKHPNILKTLLKVKGSANLHIKMFAEDRANGLLCKDELIEMCKEFNAPEWFYNAVENQKMKFWK